MLSSHIPSANEPFHQASHPNQDVTVFSGNIRITYSDGLQVEGNGQLCFRWLPNPSLYFKVIRSWGFGIVDLDGISLDIPEANITGLRGGISSVSHSVRPPEISIAGIVLDAISLCGQGTTLTELAFDIPNYHDYFGNPVRRGQCIERRRLTLEAKDWLIEINATADLSERLKGLKSVGGFVITHAGVIRRTDGSSFSFEDTAEIRNALSMWLSFSRGLWCSPVFWHCKYDSWTYYSVPRLSRWRAVQSWFPYHECQLVPNTFPRLVELLADHIWKVPLELAVYWYIHANECSGGVEGSLVLVQAALEMLAWTYLVEYKGILTEEDWNRLGGAVERVEQLLVEMGIPADFPSSQCPDLYAWAQPAGRVKSGPNALVGIRNAFVHPTAKNLKKTQEIPSSAKLQAWQLSLFYLEAIILVILGYDGPIYSRFRSGFPNNVKVDKPWLLI